MNNYSIKHIAIAISLPFYFMSCASILNRPVQRVKISTDKTIKGISIENARLADSLSVGMDSIKTYLVKRSRNYLQLEFHLDSSKTSIYLRPRNSFAFWANYCNYAIGMLIDLRNPKRFGYANSYHFTAADTLNKKYRILYKRDRPKIPPYKKGAVNLLFPLSVLNHFNINSPDGSYLSGAIYGIEGGADYYYKNNHYLSIGLGTGTDYLPVEHLGSGYIERASSLFANMRDNLVINNLSLGYGLSITKFTYWQQSLDTIMNEKSLSNTSLGLSLTAQYRITRHLSVGILYQPTFWNTSIKPLFTYQHFGTLNAIWNFHLRKGSK